MRRRAFLATGVSTCVAGCASSGLLGLGPSDGPSPDTPRTPDEAGDVPTVSDGTFVDFEDLSQWTAAEGTVVADESIYDTGTQAARVDVGPSDVRGRLDRTFDEPVDLTGRSLSMPMRATADIYPYIQLFDANGKNLNLRTPVRGNLPFQSYAFGIGTDRGCDLSEIVEVRIVQYTGGGTSLSFWCDRISLHARPETPAVTFHFDDGSETDYTQAFPLLDDHGITAATFVNTSKVGSGTKMDLEQLETLADNGWTVCSHGHAHDEFPELDRERQETLIRDAKDWLVERGFEDGADYFVYPYSSYDATTLELVSDYHRVAFAGGWPAVGRVTNPYLAPRTVDPDPETAKRELDLTVRHNGILILGFHEVDVTEDAYYPFQDFERIVEYVVQLAEDGLLDVVGIDEFASKFVELSN